MSVLIDTNILIYAVHTEAVHHRTARAFVEKRRSDGGFCVTWSILYEWLRVVTHPRVFSNPLSPEAARNFVIELTSDPRIDVLVETPRHSNFFALALDEAPNIRGNLYHDVHIASLMLEHGVSLIATADHHFRLFRFLKVMEPVTARRDTT
jgi:toxin-antitoxin system PIN domain toxin